VSVEKWGEVKMTKMTKPRSKLGLRVLVVKLKEPSKGAMKHLDQRDALLILLIIQKKKTLLPYSYRPTKIDLNSSFVSLS
jgi:hypothetical protein